MDKPDEIILEQKLIYLIDFLNLNIRECEEELKETKDEYHKAFVKGKLIAFNMTKKHYLKIDIK